MAASVLLGYAGDNRTSTSRPGALVLKVMLIPGCFTAIHKLNVRWDVEPLINVPTLMIVGIAVIFSFSLALPVSRLSPSIAGGSLGIALACVLLSFLMITRSRAVPQVIGFLSMENGLIFAATAATNGMPMIVEFGIALDVLVGILILGVFMFRSASSSTAWTSTTSKSSRKTEPGTPSTSSSASRSSAARCWPGRPPDRAGDINVAFSLGTFLAACVLTAQVISGGPCSHWTGSSSSIPSTSSW